MSLEELDKLLFDGPVDDEEDDRRLIEYLKEVEGGNRSRYKDPAGFDTIGYGHRIQPGDPVTQDSLTEDAALRLLREDVSKARERAKVEFRSLTGNQFEDLSPEVRDALTDITFNVGSLEKFPKFTQAAANDDIENMIAESTRFMQDPDTGEMVPLTGRNEAFVRTFLADRRTATEGAPRISDPKAQLSVDPTQADDLDEMLQLLAGQKTIDNLAEAAGVKPKVVESATQELEHRIESTAKIQNLAQEGLVKPAGDPLSLSTVIDDLFVHPLTSAWDGLMTGSADFYDRLQNASDLLAGIVGAEPTSLFRDIAEQVRPGDTPQSLSDSVWHSVARAVPEAGTWLLSSMSGAGLAFKGASFLDRFSKTSKILQAEEAIRKVGGTLGLGALGALTEADKGPKEAALAALEYTLLGATLQAAAPLYYTTRMATVGGIFAGQAQLSGAEPRDVLTAGITGAILAAPRSKQDIGDPRMSVGHMVMDRIGESKWWKRIQAKDLADAKKLDLYLKEGPQAVMKEVWPEEHARMEAAMKQVFQPDGRVRVKIGEPVEFKQRFMDGLADTIGMKRNSSLGLRGRLDLLLRKVDPNNRISQGERNLMAEKWQEAIERHDAILKGIAIRKHPELAADKAKATKQAEAKTTADQKGALKAKKAGEKPGAEPLIVREPLTREEYTKQRQEGAERGKKFFEEAAKRGTRQETGIIRKVHDWFEKGVVDVSADMRKLLLKLGDQKALEAIAAYDARAGANMLATQYYYDAMREAFGLKHWWEVPSQRMVHDVDRVVMARVLKDIALRKGKHDYRLPGGKKAADDILDWYSTAPSEMGKSRYLEAERMADSFFKHIKLAARRAEKAGLVSKQQADRLAEIDYMIIRHLDKIDPAPKVEDIQVPKPLKVGDSGIAYLKEGKSTLIDISTVGLLQQHLVRIENRVAKNNAMQSLWNMAIENRNNPAVRLPDVETIRKWRAEKAWQSDGKLKDWGKIKAKDTEVKVSVFRDGKQYPMFLKDSFAKGWVDVPAALSPGFAGIARVGSGSFILRPLATGYNPGFVVKNFPRDIMHAWFATREYSPLLPRFLLQMGKDLAVTSKDAFARTGRFREFGEEGGYMNFLTHQGSRDILGFPIHKRFPLEARPFGAGARWERIKSALSYLNETSEFWVRLAIRERALRNLTNNKPREATEAQRRLATHQARNYLDFSQGGRYAKGVDHFWPYLNASLQAFRTTLRRAKNEPGMFAFQLGQLAALDGFIYYTSFARNPDAHSQVGNQVRDENFVFTTNQSYIDPEGHERHLYFPIALDPTIAAFLMPSRWYIERKHFGRAPTPYDRDKWDAAKSAMAAMLPFVPRDIPIPTIAAFSTAGANYDFWFDRNIWNGPVVPYEDEFYEPGTLRKPTPAFYKDMADYVGIGHLESPVRMQAFLRKIMPQHPFTITADWLWDEWKYGENNIHQELKSQSQKFAELPIIRRAMKATHPYERLAETLEDVGKEANADTLRQNQALDRQYTEMLLGRMSFNQIMQDINRQDIPISDQQRLQDRLLAHRQLDRFLGKRGTTLPGGMPRLWWLNLKRLPPQERAELFYERYRMLQGDDRQRAWRLAMQLGFANDRAGEFMRRLKKLEQLGGKTY